MESAAACCIDHVNPHFHMRWLPASNRYKTDQSLCQRFEPRDLQSPHLLKLPPDSLGEIPRNSSKERTSQGISLSKRFYRVVTNLSSRSLLMMNRLGSSVISTTSILYKSFKFATTSRDMFAGERERELCVC